MRAQPETFRPTPDTPENRRRLAEQRRRARRALLIHNGFCAVCERARTSWPMCFRGDKTCSVNCAKTLAREDIA